MTLQKNNMES